MIEQLALEPTDREQIAEVVGALRTVLGTELVGAYLHGSAVLGGLHARSDLDVLAVSARRMARDEKERLAARLLEVSGPDPNAVPPRPVELTVAVWPEIRPWRYPPTIDLLYGEWSRDRFERGDVEPSPSRTNPDLTLLVSMVLLGDATLAGPRPSEVFDPIPPADFADALVADISALIEEIDSDTRNVVLTLARIWCGLVTGTVSAKADAAAWALPRVAAEQRAVLSRARDIYLGTEQEHWDDLRDGIRPFAAAVVHEIEEARSGRSDRTRRRSPRTHGTPGDRRSHRMTR
jgi:predicted nucleotidyltransferase